MKRILLLSTILFVSVMTTACINNFAIQELNNKAETYINNGDAETAICRLKSSLDLDNEVYQTHYNLGVAYNGVGKYEESIEELNKALELKPDLSDAYYTLAVSKEAVAYQILDSHEDMNNMNLDELSDFNNKAADAVETYNQYLVRKADAPETEQINEKIAELNNKIKECTDIYDSKNAEKDNQVQQEVTENNSNIEEPVQAEQE